MQNPNWNDLRYVLAIGRKERLSSAARLLGVDDTTVSRRLVALEATLGARVYQRSADGRLELTDLGKSLARLAEGMERDLTSLAGGGTGASEVTGVVRLTTVPAVLNHILLPALPDLLKDHGDLRLELISDARDLSLTRRETDMALRLARPRAGGSRVKARRVGMLAFAPYAAAGTAKKHAAAQAWITYDETMVHLPQARWLDVAIKTERGLVAPVKINDVEAAHQAVVSGLGRSFLPCLIADRDPRLRKLPLPDRLKDCEREVWLLTPSELCGLPRIKAVARWIEQSFALASPLLGTL